MCECVCVCVYVSRWRLSSMATHVLEFNCVKRHWQGHVAHHVVIVAQIAPTRRCITASTYMYAYMYVCMCMIRGNWVHCICIAIGAKVWANSHMCVCVFGKFLYELAHTNIYKFVLTIFKSMQYVLAQRDIFLTHLYYILPVEGVAYSHVIFHLITYFWGTWIFDFNI